MVVTGSGWELCCGVVVGGDGLVVCVGVGRAKTGGGGVPDTRFCMGVQA